MTDRYAVVGNPVAHSLSPRIHAAFAAATGQALSYETLLAPVGGFVETVEAFFARGGAGLNVTVPFKEQAARWVSELDPAARAAGAVNTIDRQRSGYRGYNTDGAGLVRDLTINCAVAIAGARVLLLGAGGAARGVLLPLLQQQPRCLLIANRTGERAEALAETGRLQAPAADVRGTSLSGAVAGFDIVINATSAGLGDAAAVADVDPAAAAGAFCYDMIYATAGGGQVVPATAFCRWAAGHGAARVQDGLGMLVEQAALAFALWRGVMPAPRPVLEMLRSHVD